MKAWTAARSCPAGRAIARWGAGAAPGDYEIPGAACPPGGGVENPPTPKGYPRRWAKIQKAPL